MIKHVFIPQSGFHIGFQQASKVDWNHAYSILNCKTIEIAQARWDGKNYEMLCDEDGLLRGKKENLKATKAYHDYWLWYNKENPDDARSEIDILRRIIKGHVILQEI